MKERGVEKAEARQRKAGRDSNRDDEVHGKEMERESKTRERQRERDMRSTKGDREQQERGDERRILLPV